ncbi:DUF5681 domain-containing protein [Mesorhizobium sp. M1423]|uniref:DUF5681 domain-containing protein n=1 Tax=Mesorhizobium sp. M1423 TaxID=2957101 RepID=UPI00333B8BFA
MSAEQDPKRQALSVRPSTGDYDVGYGKPPAKTQFKSGQSGNPKGRPKGSSNKPKPPALNEERMKTILLQEAYRTIKVNEGAGQVSVPMAQAIIRSLAVNAVKGNQRAQRLFTELLTTTERENKRLHDEWLDTALTYKVEWDRELARRERLGITGPEPLPHPDHVVVNMRTGEVAIRGPATKEEKAHHDMILQAKVEFQADLDELEQLLKDEPDYAYRAQVEADIAHNKKLLEMIRKAIPD